jgi:hypothetical protein
VQLIECSDTDVSSVDCETDSDHSVDDVAVIDTLVNSDDDYNEAVAASAENVVWENVSNYTGQREQFIEGFGPQGAAKEVQGIVESFELLFNREFVQKNCRRDQPPCCTISKFVCSGRLFPRRSVVHAWKPKTADEIYILLGLFMLIGIVYETQTVSKMGKQKRKPVCVLDYNQYMGGVNLKDQLLESYLVERKRTDKWYMKLFRMLLNSAVEWTQNSCELH